jgi:hypothetical protein
MSRTNNIWHHRATVGTDSRHIQADMEAAVRVDIIITTIISMGIIAIMVAEMEVGREAVAGTDTIKDNITKFGSMVGIWRICLF